ncbi:hypothetical protein ACVWZX_004618 [Deinococcus sp. UYEF24]
MWTDYLAFLLRAGAIRTVSGKAVTGLKYNKLFTHRLLC